MTTTTLAPLLITAALAATACGGRQVAVRTERDSFADFSSYRTFNFKTGPSGIRNPFLDREARRSIGASLVAKGYRYDTTAAPDLVVEYYVAVADRAKVSHVAVAYRGRYVSGVSRRTLVSPYKEGTLFVDVYDRARGQLVWRGRAAGTANDDGEARKKTRAALDKVMKPFPARS